MIWTLSIPIVPVSQNSPDWRIWKSQHRIRKEWERTVWALAKEQRIPQLKKATLEATIYFPDNRRRDYDNFFAPLWKGVQEGLVCAGVFADDNSSIVKPSVPDMEIDPDKPRTEVRVIEWT